MRHYLSLLITLAALWLVLSGHYTLDHTLVAVTAVASCSFIAWLSRRMDLADNAWASFYLYPHKVLLYQLWLVKEIVLANLDVTRRILFTRSISPTVCKVSASQRTPFGRVTFANSITLTPGTVSMRLDEDGILIHALSREGAESFADGEMDRRVSELERGDTQ